MIQETAFSVILWADNSAHWHNQAQKLLNQHYAVQAVADEAAVETAVRSRMPDVIFGDVTMLKRDGFRWLREFRANSRFGGVPVILLATHAQEEICLEGIEAGASDYLLAPFSERELLTRVKVNLTARLRQAAALRESEARFQQIAETIQNVFWMIELPSHRVLYVSPAYESIWGSPRENLYDNPNSWLAVIHPEDRERVQRALADHVRTGGFDQEYRVVRPDGSLRWVRDRGFPIQNKAGQVYRVTGIAEDITDHKQAKASLQQADDRLRQQVSQLEQTNKILHNTLEELQVTEEELRQQNEELAIARELTEVEKFRYQDLFDFAPDGYLVTDANGIIREANQAIATLVKIKPSYLLNTPLAVYISNPDRKAFRNLLFEWHQHPQQQKLQTDALSLNSGGHSIPVAMTGAATRDAQGQIVCIRWLIQNITERKRFEKALFEEKELAQVTLQSIGDAVITTNAQGQVRSLNPVAEHLTGWTTGEAEGLPIAEVFKVVNELTGEPIENPVETVQREGHKVRLSKHLVLIARNGLKYAVDDSAAPIRSSDGQMVGVVLVFHDVTQSRNLARQLSWQATHDALTGLLNRQEFERRLQAAISTAGDEHHTLCYIDLDQFKVVNDTCGHAAGDELLRQLTALLQQRVRTTDTLARLGGDEFGLLLHQCPLPQAEKIADTLRQLIGDFRFSWQGKTFPIGASIGVVTIDETTLNLTGVLSAADAACYAAKEKGRDRIHVYRNNNLELRQHSERQWIAKINRALAENRFQLYCQKIVPITGTEGEYAEILLRLVDGSQIVPPMAFIPAAERYALMPAIDRWVVRTFFAKYEEYCQRQPLGGNHRSLYTINLSGASVNSEQFLEFLKEQFSQFQIPPQTICFEITETTAIANLSQAIGLIYSLKRFGCSFALDDFGSGMSSLIYLKNLPVDYLKIDGSFVRNLISDRIDCTMVEYISRLGQVMQIKTIAEFVEDEATLEKLRTLGVDYAQGYGVAKPCPLSFGE